ncbi:hypothetical protein BWI97_26905, partial [Siphonobacter sp. BAB-5405]
TELTNAYDGTIDQQARESISDERWSCLTREQITQKNDSLDLGLMADASVSGNNPDEEPLDIAREAAEELKAIHQELEKIIELLG